MSYVIGLPNNSYKPITNTVWVRTRLCKLQKRCTRLTVASDKVSQVLAHGRWFSPGTPASSTAKTGRHDIAEILLKVALNTINQIKSNHRILIPLARSIFNNIWEITDNRVSMMNIKNKSRYTGVFPLSSKPEGKYPGKTSCNLQMLFCTTLKTFAVVLCHSSVVVVRQ